MNLYTRMLNLEDDGLVVRRENLDFVLFKYHNKVFYNNLWGNNSALLEARGIVFNKLTGEVVQRPIEKCFNVGENNTPAPTDDLLAYRKVNGFMASASLYNGRLFVTTTGSLDSEYQQLAEKRIRDSNAMRILQECMTHTFEIVDESDPHIVPEDSGVYLLTGRAIATGSYMRQPLLDGYAEEYDILRPELETPYNPNAEHEGYMFYTHWGNPVSKLKTPHYLSKKALMRMGRKQTGIMFNDPEQFKKRLDEEFFDVFDYLLSEFTQEEYYNMSEQGRRDVIEEYFYG